MSQMPFNPPNENCKGECLQFCFTRKDIVVTAKRVYCDDRGLELQRPYIGIQIGDSDIVGFATVVGAMEMLITKELEE